MVELDDDLRLGHVLADTGRAVALGRFGGPLERRTKSDGSLVTDADEAVEDAIRTILAEARPEDAVLGEERGLTGSGPRRWIVDGIDGTVNFARGTTAWGILVALEVDGEIVVGIHDQPPHLRRSWAATGRGAHAVVGLDEVSSPIAVSDAGELATARSLLPGREHCPDDESRRAVARLRASTRPWTHTDDFATQIARGGAEIGLYWGAGPWDLAAPAIILEEAGGRFSDLAGGHDLYTGVGIFTNGRVHDAVLATLAPPA